MSNYTFESLQAEYAKRWTEMSINPNRLDKIASAATKINAHKDVYTSLQGKTGVPWYFIGIVHLRESDLDFHTHLHNGDSLNARTHNVPSGRPKIGNPPFTFEDSAVDALQYEGFTKIKDWSIERIAYCFEQYNGFGYRAKGVPSAYLWSGSNQYNKGKFVADHVFDRNVADVQLGCMCVLKYILEHYAATETAVTVEPEREETPEEYETPAKAIIPRPTTEQMNQVSRKHWWSDWLQWLGISGALGGTAFKGADATGIEAVKPVIYTMKELGTAIGVYGLIALLAAMAIYFMYQKKLMKDDVQEGRSTPSGGEPGQ